MQSNLLTSLTAGCLLVCLFRANADTPIFTSHPLSRTVEGGGSVIFSPALTADPQPSFQWQFDGADLLSATNQSLLITNCHPRHAGDYRLIATNSFGAATSQVAVLTVITSSPGFLRLPASLTRPVGRTVAFSVIATGTPVPTLQWKFNGTNLPGRTTSTLSNSYVTFADAGTYSVVASNYVSVIESPAVTLDVVPAPTHPGAVDLSFTNPVNPRFVGIDCMAVEPDKKIILSGTFLYNGVARGHIARLNRDGSLDPSFDPGTGLDLPAEKIIIQKDGKILIGGSFNVYNGTARRGVARLNPDGSLDTSFNSRSLAGGEVRDIAVDPQGRVVAVGRLTGGIPHLVRLFPNGALDSRMHGTHPDGLLSAIAMADDSSWIIGGLFSTLSGTSRNSLARQLASGAVDMSFGPNAAVETSGQITTDLLPDFDEPASVATLLSHGSGMLVGGSFRYSDGIPTANIARFKSNGDIDRSFKASLTGTFLTYGYGRVDTLALDREGRIFAAGRFTNSQPVYGLARLNWDGTFDNSMQLPPELNGAITAISSQGDVLVAGMFTSIDGVLRRGIARLHGPAEKSPAISTPPRGHTAISGEHVSLYVSANGGYSLAYQWLHDGQMLGGATNGILTLSNVSPAMAGEYVVTLSNSLGAVSSPPATLGVLERDSRPGALYSDFQSLPGANTNIWCTAVQRDGKILIGGDFTLFHDEPRRYLVRLNSDGTLDNSFQAPTLTGGGPRVISAIQITSTGKIMIGGSFGQVNGVSRSGLARLNADGSLDESFRTPNVQPLWVTSMALQPDNASIVADSALRTLRRFRSDGSEDLDFPPRNSLGGQINALQQQPDGKLLVAGWTPSMGNNYGHLLRLLPDGTLDRSFSFTTYTHYIECIALQPDRKILVGGWFPGSQRERLLRLNSDGSFDTSFGTNNILAASSQPVVRTIKFTPDNRILVGGFFHRFNEVGRSHMIRLFPDGQLDLDFGEHIRPAAGAVNAIEVLPDGSVLAAGNFTLNHHPGAGRIARFHGGPETPVEWTLLPTNTVARPGTSAVLAAQSIGFPPATYQWFRGGELLADQTNSTLTIANARENSSGGYHVIAANASSSITSAVVQLTVAPEPLHSGSLDLNFFSGFGPDGPVHVVLVQNDGRIAIGGSFHNVDGIPRSGIARLNRNGTLDTSFDPGTGTGVSTRRTVLTLAEDAQGRLLVGGNFTNLNGAPHSRLVRLRTDGTIDSDFNLPPDFPNNLDVTAIIVLPDQRLLVGGVPSLGLSPRPAKTIVGLFTDGAADPSFEVPTNILAANSLLLDSQNRLYLGTAPFFAPKPVMRLNPDGSVDPTFSLTATLRNVVPDPCFPSDGGVMVADVFDLAVQENSRLVIVGIFAASNMLRVNTNGTTDSSFRIGAGPDAHVQAIANYKRDQLLIGGCFFSFNGIPRRGIALLKSDGSVNPSFQPGAGANGLVRDVAVQPDGQIIIVGDFTEYDGLPRPRIARLNSELFLEHPRVSDGRFEIQVLGVRSRAYVLESTPSVSPPDWRPVAHAVGAGSTLTLRDADATAPAAFYRVRIQLPTNVTVDP